MVTTGRGILCDTIQEKAKKFLGEEITTKELRLYPYLDYVVKNKGYIEITKVDDEELDIVTTRQVQGHLKLTSQRIYLSRPFYDFIQDILADSYVTFMEEIG